MTRRWCLAVRHAFAVRAVIVPALALAALGSVTIAQPREASAAVPVSEQIECLALTIYFEARGESDLGKLAVGHVVMNRVSDPRFPGNVCDVVRQGGEDVLHRCQFSWWCDGQSDEPRQMKAWRKIQVLARRVFWQYSDDPTDGAMWYHADYVQPDWRTKFAAGPTIGQHIFYREPGEHASGRRQVAQEP